MLILLIVLTTFVTQCSLPRTSQHGFNSCRDPHFFFIPHSLTLKDLRANSWNSDKECSHSYVCDNPKEVPNASCVLLFTMCLYYLLRIKWLCNAFLWELLLGCLFPLGMSWFFMSWPSMEHPDGFHFERRLWVYRSMRIGLSPSLWHLRLFTQFFPSS